MTAAEHILVVDDDPKIREIIDSYLTEEGFRVSLVPDGEAMQKILDDGPVDLVILDVRLPGEDGLTLAAQLRQHTQAGIVMLSRKDDLVDRVAGLEVGADDYLAKPFHLRELLARVRSVLRRRNVDPEPKSAADADGPSETMVFSGYELDRVKRLLLDSKGNPVELSAGEFDLLLTFLDHPKRVLSRNQILDYAQGRDAVLFDRSVDVQVGRLRRKLEINPQKPQLIKTVRGAGYRFEADILKG